MRWLSLLHTRPDKDRRRNERGHQGPLRVAADDSLVGIIRLTLRGFAARVAFLVAQINSTVVRLKRITEQFAPSLVAMYGVGPDTASTLLLTAGDNPDRLRNERSFASPTGSCPVPATSGLIETRHGPRLRVGGSGMATGGHMDRPSRSPWLVCREVALVDAVVLGLEERRGCSRDSRRVWGRIRRSWSRRTPRGSVPSHRSPPGHRGTRTAHVPDWELPQPQGQARPGGRAGEGRCLRSRICHSSEAGRRSQP